MKYLGTNRKREGKYTASFSNTIKRSWTEYMKLSELESKEIEKLLSLKKLVDSANSLPEKIQAQRNLRDGVLSFEKNPDIDQLVKYHAQTIAR